MRRVYSFCLSSKSGQGGRNEENKRGREREHGGRNLATSSLLLIGSKWQSDTMKSGLWSTQRTCIDSSTTQGQQVHFCQRLAWNGFGGNGVCMERISWQQGGHGTDYFSLAGGEVAVSSINVLRAATRPSRVIREICSAFSFRGCRFSVV